MCDVSSNQHQYILRKAPGKHQYILAKLLGQHVTSSPLAATSPPSTQLVQTSSSHLAGASIIQSYDIMVDSAAVGLETFFDHSYSELDQEISTAQSQFTALQCQIDDAVARKKALVECDPRLALGPSPGDGKKKINSHSATSSGIGAD